MADRISSFAEILAPMSEETFMRDYFGQKPLHLEGAAEKFQAVMDWSTLTDLVNQSAIWSSKSLALVMDGRRLSPEEYCRRDLSRHGMELMMADMDRVKGWLGKGASMVLNEIDQLTPGLRAAAGALEQALNGKAQGNLYCSWKAHPAFGSHFDTHDVFAIHVAGEKVWNVYQRHFLDPIAHPRFKNLDRAFDEAHKGTLEQQVRLTPGDLLYLPRGYYHDALAESDAAVHIAFGVTFPIGLDLIGPLHARLVDDELFRARLPNGDRDALGRHVEALAERLRELAMEPAVGDQLYRVAEDFRYDRTELSLPDDGGTGSAYRVDLPDIQIATVSGKRCMVRKQQAVPIPAGLEPPIAWVLNSKTFRENDLAKAHPELTEQARQGLLQNLRNMDVISEI